MGSLLQEIGNIFYAVFQEPVYNVLMLLYHLVGNFAIALVLLTLLIRLILLPLTRKQLQSSRKMQELQPQIKALQAQYRGDPQGQMAAQRQLFKENNYSQMQGCLPLLIQMPMLYALFGSFRTVITQPAASQHITLLQQINQAIYPFLPKLTQLPYTPFLWTDLAHPDPTHILPFIAAALTFIQLRMAMPVRPKPQPGQPPDTTAQATQFTMYLMPAITFLFGLSFPSGMALYWCVGTLFMVVQQYFLAGWGSLFVGVPGMERFVPAPKLPLAPAVVTGRGGARPGTYSAVGSSRNGASSASPRAVTSAPTEPAPAKGGFFARLREQMEAQRQAQAEAAAERANAAAAAKGKIVDSTAEVQDDEDQPASAAGGIATSSRTPRQRAAKQAPQLVKPAHTSTSAQLSGSPLAHVGSNGTSGSRGSRGSNGTGGTGGTGATPKPAQPAATSASAGERRAPTASAPTNGAKRVAASSAANARPSNGGQRKGSGGAKGATPARPRQSGSMNNPNKLSNTGRPKGGR